MTFSPLHVAAPFGCISKFKISEDQTPEACLVSASQKCIGGCYFFGVFGESVTIDYLITLLGHPIKLFLSGLLSFLIGSTSFQTKQGGFAWRTLEQTGIGEVSDYHSEKDQGRGNNTDSEAM